MKRVFALALAICMALSMMVLTASAATFTCKHGTETCTNPDHAGKQHIYVHSVTATQVGFCRFYAGPQPIAEDRGMHIDAFTGKPFTPAKGMLIWGEGSASTFNPMGVCKYPPHSAATGNCKEVKYTAKSFVCKHDNDISYELQAGNVIRSGCTIDATYNILLGENWLSGTNNLLNADVEVMEVNNPSAYLKLSEIVPHGKATGTCKRVMGNGEGSFFCEHDDGSEYPLKPCDIIKRDTEFNLSCLGDGAIYVDGTRLITLKSIDPTQNKFPWDARVISIEGGVLRCELIKPEPQPEPQPQPQPKTGVMDTLPLWFGVMAVSACAYILTSKKKVF